MRILPIGEQSHRGFTLLEMLVVLAIIGLLLALAIPVYAKLSPRLRIMAAQHQLLIDLRHARNEAVTSQKTVAVAFFPVEQTYVAGDLKHKPGVDFDVALDGINQGSKSTPVFYFYSDGSASGGNIVLVDAGFGANIHIDGLTGQVVHDEK
jgi:prepilin-type N-terminal cleavage/methylation domain-containing protein